MKSTTASVTRVISTGALAALLSSGAVFSQTPDRPAGSQDPGAQRPAPGAAMATAGDDRTFVTEMSIAGMAEVQLGELAQQRAEHADVKAFGQMMVKDHTQANAELTKIASSLGLAPARELDQKHRDVMMKLSGLKGAAFDRAYMDAMVAGHEEVLMKLQQRTGGGATSASAASGGAAAGTSTGAPNAAGQSRESGQAVGTGGTAAGGASLDQWAAKTAPAVKQHLQRARDIQKAVSQAAR